MEEEEYTVKDIITDMVDVNIKQVIIKENGGLTTYKVHTYRLFFLLIDIKSPGVV